MLAATRLPKLSEVIAVTGLSLSKGKRSAAVLI